MNDTPTPETSASKSEVTPTFGWNTYAERLNGRFAMIGFVALLVLDFFTGQGLLTWVGLR
ncbi:MAG: chlorophyll a/b-binding protein [Cyanobacteria bacterium J06641_5]